MTVAFSPFLSETTGTHLSNWKILCIFHAMRRENGNYLLAEVKQYLCVIFDESGSKIHFYKNHKNIFVTLFNGKHAGCSLWMTSAAAALRTYVSYYQCQSLQNGPFLFSPSWQNWQCFSSGSNRVGTACTFPQVHALGKKICGPSLYRRASSMNYLLHLFHF